MFTKNKVIVKKQCVFELFIKNKRKNCGKDATHIFKRKHINGLNLKKFSSKHTPAL